MIETPLAARYGEARGDEIPADLVDPKRRLEAAIEAAERDLAAREERRAKKAKRLSERGQRPPGRRWE